MFKSIPLLLALASPALLTKIDNVDFCEGPYALCAASFCEKIPGNTTHAHCSCEGPFNGLNAGNTTCKARTESLISTFSIQDEFTSPINPPLYTLTCEGDNAGPIANCFDAPCSTAFGGVVCDCPVLSGNITNQYLGQTCPKNETEAKHLCSMLRSSGTYAANTENFVSAMRGFYGNPPSAQTCNFTG